MDERMITEMHPIKHTGQRFFYVLSMSGQIAHNGTILLIPREPSLARELVDFFVL